MVVYRDGFGKLISESDESMTICLEPWKYKKVYTPSTENEGNAIGSPRQRARLARWEPSLEEYVRKEQSDTVPQE